MRQSGMPIVSASKSVIPLSGQSRCLSDNTDFAPQILRPLNRNRRCVTVLLSDMTILEVLKQFAYIDWQSRTDSEYAKFLTDCKQR